MSTTPHLLAVLLLQPADSALPYDPLETTDAPAEDAPTPPPETSPTPSPPTPSSPTPSPPTPVQAEAEAEAESESEPEPEPEFDRRGLILRVAAGLANCLGDFCDDDELRVKIGPGALLELGYRPIEYVSFGAGINVARMKVDVDTDPGEEVDAKALMVSPLAFFFVHPVKTTRLDPYAGVSVGWQLNRSTYEASSSSSSGEGEFGAADRETIVTLKRGTARLTGGLDIYVARHVAIGPRFDLLLGFGGEVCVDDGDDEACDDVDDAFDNDEEEELPRNWMFGLNLSATF